MRFVSKFKSLFCVLGILCFPSMVYSMHKKSGPDSCKDSGTVIHQLRIFEDEYGIKLAFYTSDVCSHNINPNVCDLCEKRLSAYPWHAMCWNGHWMCASCFLDAVDKLISDNDIHGKELKGFKLACCGKNINSPLLCVDYEAANHNKKDCLTCQYIKSYNEFLSKQNSERNEYCNGFVLFSCSNLPSYKGNNFNNNSYSSKEKIRILNHLKNTLMPKNKDPEFIIRNYV